MIGAGGVLLPPEGYIQGVADLCAEHGILLVIDSVICGFGRLGTWFGIERWPDVTPDLITFAKGVTSGYIPLGGVVAASHDRRAVLRRARRPDVPPRRDLRGAPGGLRGGAGRARHLRGRGPDPARAGTREPLADALAPLADHPAVSEVRAGLGFLAAVASIPTPRGAAGCWPRGHARKACSCALCWVAWRCRRR